MQTKDQAPTESSSSLPSASRRHSVPLRDCWYEIDLGAIRHNYHQLRAHLPKSVQIIACLKRNGYGCGAGQVARALMEVGTDGFAVAALPDAIAIREMGVNLPILLYPGPLPAAAKTIESLGLTVTVSSRDELERWRSAMSVTRIFVKVDLGFFRAGATPQEVGRLLTAAHDSSNVEVQGLYAHLSELPASAAGSVDEQFARLRRILQEAEASGIRPPIAMLSSTEGALRYPAMDLDAVDPGALFIGLSDTDHP
uniref:alanine racemase n=1 Tax=Ensifer aridi TaxID=1708715 RepID=UPI0015E31625